MSEIEVVAIMFFQCSKKQCIQFDETRTNWPRQVRELILDSNSWSQGGQGAGLQSPRGSGVGLQGPKGSGVVLQGPRGVNG